MSKSPTTPLQKASLFSILRTIFRSKALDDGDYTQSKKLRLPAIDATQLKAYKAYFSFPEEHKIPLSYLYLIAQPAQLALMLEKGFPLPLPGMVHLNNRITFLKEMKLDHPLDIEVTAHIPAKASGSLFPVITVDFFQQKEKVAVCESGYFVRRKSPKKKNKKRKEKVVCLVAHQENWIIPADAGRTYARLSGDYNPIHLSRVFARISGFKACIIHGWYSLSKALSAIENAAGKPVREVQVDFRKPILIPSKVILEYSGLEDSPVEFSIQRDNQEIQCLIGKLAF